MSSLLWPVTSEVLAVLLYKDYSSFAQTISELTSIGAPTRTALIVEGFFYEGLIIAFGIGVRQSARGKTSLRVAGGLLIAYGAVGPLWLPFPMTARVDIMPTAAFAVPDVMHLILGAVDALLYVAILGFGSAALGGGFRVYSILTLVVVLRLGPSTSPGAAWSPSARDQQCPQRQHRPRLTSPAEAIPGRAWTDKTHTTGARGTA